MLGDSVRGKVGLNNIDHVMNTPKVCLVGYHIHVPWGTQVTYKGVYMTYTTAPQYHHQW